MHYKDERGFTLVELLVVIIIIGILAAIAIPVFLNQKKRAADGVLKADMRKVAMTVEEWAYEHGSWDELRAITGRSDSLKFVGTGITPAPPAEQLWNNYPALKNIWVSEAVDISVDYRTTLTSVWTEQHDFGEFCLSGRHINSSYAYPGGNGALYDQMLYYDVMYGGLATMEQLVEAKQAGKDTSCTGWVNGYMTAHGIT